ncbi:MAG: hypothetical protein ACE5E0_04385 [Terriglobia bacterium]
MRQKEVSIYMERNELTAEQLKNMTQAEAYWRGRYEESTQTQGHLLNMMQQQALTRGSQPRVGGAGATINYGPGYEALSVLVAILAGGVGLLVSDSEPWYVSVGIAALGLGGLLFGFWPKIRGKLFGPSDE